VPLVLADQSLRALQGLALRDIGLRLEIGASTAPEAGNPATGGGRAARQGRGAPAETRGDLLFTHFGISGPAVLRLSRLLPDPFPNSPVYAVLNLMPDLSPAAVDRRLIDRFASEPPRPIHNTLTAGLP